MHNLSHLTGITFCGPFSPPQSAAGTINTAEGSGIFGDIVVVSS